MRHIIKLVILSMSLSLNSFGQGNRVLSQIIKSDLKFQKQMGVFEPKEFETIDNQKIAYLFRFSNKLISIAYRQPKQSELSDTACGYFEINNSVVKMAGLFPDDFACEIDINSINVYTTQFHNKKYLLITAINKGSGLSASTIVMNLFDITNPSVILYYPLWSIYGNPSCFGDYNKDGVLDFLQVRSTGKNSIFKIEFTSLKGNHFIPSMKNYYMIVKRKGTGMQILSKHWF